MITHRAKNAAPKIQQLRVRIDQGEYRKPVMVMCEVVRHVGEGAIVKHQDAFMHVVPTMVQSVFRPPRPRE